MNKRLFLNRRNWVAAVMSLMFLLSLGLSKSSAQSSMHTDGSLIVPNHSGKYTDFTIPSNSTYPYLQLSAYGGDGGRRRYSVFTTCTKNGGQGAQISALFKIGADELQPDGKLRFIYGKKGENAGGNGVEGAGGGGGAMADAASIHHDGQPGHDATYGSGENAGMNGWSAYSPGGGSIITNVHKEFGRGWKIDADPDRRTQYDYVNGAESGFGYLDGYIVPKGGKATSDLADGGYGFGSGGCPGLDLSSSRGGGGGSYSGGSVKPFLGGGGGGSYVDADLPAPGTSLKMSNVASTAHPANGHVRYLFSKQLMVSRSMRNNDHLTSGSAGGLLLKNGPFELYWQGDGNLVLKYYYDPDRLPNTVWSSGTAGNYNSRLVFQGDGNLVIYSGGTPLWATATADAQKGGKGGVKLELNGIGDLRIRNADNKVIWNVN